MTQDFERTIFDTILIKMKDLYENNPEYRTYEDKLLKHIEGISDKTISEALKTALIEIEDILAEAFYLEGFKDGKELLNLIGKGA